VATERDDFCVFRLEGRDEANQFFGVPRVTDGQDAVAGDDHSEVSMKSFSRMKKDCKTACARQSGCDFLANFSRLPNSADHDFSTGLQRLLKQPEGIKNALS
jgi:hypothetical protein